MQAPKIQCGNREQENRNVRIKGVGGFLFSLNIYQLFQGTPTTDRRSHRPHLQRISVLHFLCRGEWSVRLCILSNTRQSWSGSYKRKITLTCSTRLRFRTRGMIFFFFLHCKLDCTIFSKLPNLPVLPFLICKVGTIAFSRYTVRKKYIKDWEIALVVQW